MAGLHTQLLKCQTETSDTDCMAATESWLRLMACGSQTNTHILDPPEPHVGKEAFNVTFLLPKITNSTKVQDTAYFHPVNIMGLM